jgi:hypothetical protein
MPRYFFDVLDGGLIRDEEGLELASIEAARMEVLRTLPAMAADVRARREARQLRIDVRDETGKYVLVGTLTVVVEEPDL